MHDISWYDTRLKRFCLLLLAPALLFGASSCSTSTLGSGYVHVRDVDFGRHYSKKEAHAKWSGQEIVGVWVSKIVRGSSAWKSTLLIRPNGSGILRISGVDHPLTWRFDTFFKDRWIYKAGTAGEDYINYDGQCLLMQNWRDNNRVCGSFVFVRANDEAAVEDHLRKRQQP